MQRTLTLALLLAACAAAPDPAPAPAPDGPPAAELAATLEALRAMLDGTGPAAPDAAPTDAAAPGPADGLLDEAAARLARRRELKSVLADDYVDQGRRALDLARVDEAAMLFATALDLAPSHAAARDELRLARALAGEGPASLGASFEDEVGRVQVKREQLRLELEGELELAEAALERGDHEEALQRLSLAQMLLGANPWLARR